MNLQKLPNPLLFGIIVFPVIIILNIILFILTLGKINILFWLIIPSIIFEELFEKKYYVFSDNQIANIVFVLIFWFIVGASLGWIAKQITNQTKE